MKRKCFLAFAIFVSLSLISQITSGTSASGKQDRYFQFPASLLYGSKFLQNNTFNKQLNSLSNYKFNNTISFVGICWSGEVISTPRNQFQPHLYYSQVLPQVIILNDSAKANLTGFQFGLGLWGTDLLKRKKNSSLSLTLGFNTGQLKFYGNAHVAQKNPFFSPKITVKPWVRIGRIFIGAIIDYEYDISQTAWKNLKGAGPEQLPLAKLSQSGISVQLNAGYMIKYRSAKDKKIAKNKKNNKRKGK